MMQGAVQRGMSRLPHFALMGTPGPGTDSVRAVPAGTTVDYFWPKIATALFVSDPATINQGVAKALLETGQFKNITVLYETTEPGWLLNDWGKLHVIATTTVPFASMVGVANAIEAGMGQGNFVNPQSEANFADSQYVQLAPGPAPQVDQTSRGIDSVLVNMQDDNSDFDVLFTDGTSGLFDGDGVFYSGNRGGIDHLESSTDTAGNPDGFVAIMQDGSDVYFNYSGDWVGTFDPHGAAPSGGAGSLLQRAITDYLNPGPTGGGGGLPPASQIALAPAVGGTYSAAQIQAMIADAMKKQGAAVSDWFDATGHFNYTKLLSAVGLGAVPAALGFSAGAVVGGAAIFLYLIFNGFGGKRR